MPNPSSSPRYSVFHAVAGLLILAAAIALWRAGRAESHRPPPQSEATAAIQPGLNSPQPAAPPSVATAPAKKAVSAQTFDWFQRRPFAVVKSSGTHEWTAEDGRTADAILDLAHNDFEVQRLIDENDRIKRRQLVYRKETVPALLDRARAAGEPLQALTLPALDGQEVEVEVTDIREEPSLHGGTVTGRVKGRFNSMVSVGFANGYESFNVLSPEDGMFLTADAREPGEVIVKEIDPEKYAPPMGDAPDFVLNKQASPNARHR